MPCRGIRGATTVKANTSEAIASGTRELLEAMVAANGLAPAELASAIFTVTHDLNAGFPARAAREMGWTHVPLLCASEIQVPDAPERCIRVLLHWNTEIDPADVVHVYLRRARRLRPDLSSA